MGCVHFRDYAHLISHRFVRFVRHLVDGVRDGDQSASADIQDNDENGEEDEEAEKDSASSEEEELPVVENPSHYIRVRTSIQFAFAHTTNICSGRPY